MSTISIPGNANYSGTVSASLFVSNQVLVAPVAAGTSATLTIGSLSSTYLTVSSMTANYLSSSGGTIGNLSFGTTLNISTALIATPGLYGSPSVGTFGGSGDKIVCYPGSNSIYPYSVGVGVNNDLWHSVPSTSQHTWFVGGTQKAVLNSSGFLGINSTPAYTTDVSGISRISGGTNCQLYLNSASSGINGIRFNTNHLNNALSTGYGGVVQHDQVYGTMSLFISTNSVSAGTTQTFPSAALTIAPTQNVAVAGSLSVLGVSVPKVQAGTVTTSSGKVVVTYPISFVNTPIVLATWSPISITQAVYSAVVSGNSATGCTITGYYYISGTTTYIAGSDVISWLATGY